MGGMWVGGGWFKGALCVGFAAASAAALIQYSGWGQIKVSERGRYGFYWLRTSASNRRRACSRACLLRPRGGRLNTHTRTHARTTTYTHATEDVDDVFTRLPASGPRASLTRPYHDDVNGLIYD